MKINTSRLVLMALLVTSFACQSGQKSTGLDLSSIDDSEEWYLVRISGQDSGWRYSKTIRQKLGDRILIRTESEFQMTVMRSGQSSTTTTSTVHIEDVHGNLIEASQTKLRSGQPTKYSFKASGNKGKVTISIMDNARELPVSWEGTLLGPAGAHALSVKRGLAPGTRYDYQSFSFDVARGVTNTVETRDVEEVELLDGQKQRLHHSVSKVDFLPGVEAHSWVDEKASMQKMSVSVMGFELEFIRTTQDRARRKPELPYDTLSGAMMKTNVRVPGPYHLDSVLYRIKVKDPKLAMPDLSDGQIQVLRSSGREMLVRVRSRVPRTTQKRPLIKPPGDVAEFLLPNSYVQSDHAGLRAKALAVVGDEADAWRAACLLERFVCDYIDKKDFGTHLASAGEVFERRTGDCSEHAVLLAAMSRAVGIPSRVVTGIVYLNGTFGGHAWTEVWIKDSWYPLDATLGLGRTTPVHMALARPSLKTGSFGESMADMITTFGNLEFNVEEFTRGKQTVKIGPDFEEDRIEGNLYTNRLFGVSLTKPENYKFVPPKGDSGGILVTLKGDNTGMLMVTPLKQPEFTEGTLKKELAISKMKVKSITSHPIGKLPGWRAKVLVAQQKALMQVVVNRGSVFSLALFIDDEKRDTAVFDSMVQSLKITKHPSKDQQ